MNTDRTTFSRPVTILAGILCACALVRAQSVEGTNVRFEGAVNWTLGIQAPEFIADYQSVLGGTASSFGIPIGARASLSQYLNDNISIGLSGGFFRASIRETYTYDPKPPAERYAPMQNVTQSIEVTAAPVFATIDFYPVKRQFTGFFGLGLGLLFGDVLWTEEIQTSRLPGARTSGTRFNESMIVPALKLRTGVSLGFDGPINARSASGIRIEVGYTIAPMHHAFMAGQFDSFAVPLPERLQGNYSIDPGGMSIEIGFFLLLRQRPTPARQQGRM